MQIQLQTVVRGSERGHQQSRRPHPWLPPWHSSHDWLGDLQRSIEEEKGGGGQSMVLQEQGRSLSLNLISAMVAPHVNDANGVILCPQPTLHMRSKRYRTSWSITRLEKMLTSNGSSLMRFLSLRSAFYNDMSEMHCSDSY
jgi:hypothetical protein